MYSMKKYWLYDIPKESDCCFFTRKLPDLNLIQVYEICHTHLNPVQYQTQKEKTAGQKLRYFIYLPLQPRQLEPLNITGTSHQLDRNKKEFFAASLISVNYCLSVSIFGHLKKFCVWPLRVRIIGILLICSTIIDAVRKIVSARLASTE